MHQSESGEFKAGGVIGRPDMVLVEPEGCVLFIECPYCLGSKTIVPILPSQGAREAQTCPACHGKGQVMTSPIGNEPGEHWSTRQRFSALEIILALGFVLMLIAWFVV